MIDLKEYDLIQIYLLCIRHILDCNVSLDLFLGIFYLLCHQLYFVLFMLIVCFTTNINHLFIAALISFINIYLIMQCKTCPIYLMEQKYLNTSFLVSSMKMCGIDLSSVKNINSKKHFTKYLNYRVDEFTLEVIFSVCVLIVLKIMLLIIL